MASLFTIFHLISCTAVRSDFSAATASKVHAIHFAGAAGTSSRCSVPQGAERSGSHSNRQQSQPVCC